MIADFRLLLEHARRDGRAVSAFSCYDTETAVAVLRVASSRPVVVLVPAALALEQDGELVVVALRAIAERAVGPVCLQLDHAHRLDEIHAACELGLNAVMVDGSGLSRDANAELVLAARAITAPHHVALEAALGRVAGDEEVAMEVDADPDGLTDPDDAQVFVQETRRDCLAVAAGNVHGIYRDRPSLQTARIRAIRACSHVPLVLHGGSDLRASTIQEAVTAGITKINFNTELRQAYLNASLRGLPDAMEGARSLRLHRQQINAVADVVAEKLAVVWPVGPDSGRGQPP